MCESISLFDTEETFLRAIITGNVVEACAIVNQTLCAKQSAQFWARFVYENSRGFAMFRALLPFDSRNMLGARELGARLVWYYWSAEDCAEFERITALTVTHFDFDDAWWEDACLMNKLRAQPDNVLDIALARLDVACLANVARISHPSKLSARCYYWLGRCADWRAIDGLTVSKKMGAESVSGWCNFVMGLSDCAARDEMDAARIRAECPARVFHYVDPMGEEKFWWFAGNPLTDLIEARAGHSARIRAESISSARAMNCLCRLAICASESVRCAIRDACCADQAFIAQLLIFASRFRNNEGIDIAQKIHFMIDGSKIQ